MVITVLDLLGEPGTGAQSRGTTRPIFRCICVHKISEKAVFLSSQVSSLSEIDGVPVTGSPGGYRTVLAALFIPSYFSR